MKSKKLLGILIILVVVQVWASDDQYNKENVDGTNNNHALLEENSERKHDDENLDTNPNKNENIYDRVDKNGEEKSDDVNKDHDAIQQKFEQDDPNIKFKIDFDLEDDPNIKIQFDESNAIIIFESIEPIQNSSKMNSLSKLKNLNIQVKLILHDLQLLQELDLQQFTYVDTLHIEKCTCVDEHSELSLPKNINTLVIDESNGSNINIRLSEKTTIETLMFYVRKNDVIEWKNIYRLPKVSTLQINGSRCNDDNHYLEGLQNITKLDNAHHVEYLFLKDLIISELQLQNYHSLKYLYLENCRFESQHTKILAPKETTVTYEYEYNNGGWNKGTLQTNKDTTVTFVTDKNTKNYEFNFKKNETESPFCLII